MKTMLAGLLIFVALSVTGQNAFSQEKIKILSTLSTYADIAKQVGAEHVEVEYIASPRFDPHFIEPRPSDIFRLKKAGLFIHSGLDLEAWRSALLDAAARSEVRSSGSRQLDLSVGIPILNIPAGNISRADGDIHLFGNPHYWLDPRNGIILAQSLAAKLSEIDPGHAVDYRRNTQLFTSKLESKIGSWSELMLPYAGRSMVGHHDAWLYLMTFCGLKMDQFLEPKPGIAPTPAQLESIISYIRMTNVPAVIRAVYDPAGAANTLAEQTAVKVAVLSNSVGDMPQSTDYIAMFDYNISRLHEVLKGE